MKRFEKQAAQGDIFIRRVRGIPKKAKAKREKKAGPVIVAHSETGHHHAFDASSSVWLYSTPDQLVSYLKVEKPAVLKHHRDFDTHEEILFDVGTYEIRRQREWSPEGWRRVED